MASTRYTLHPRRRWTSGALVCLAMFAFGGLLLWGLFEAPRAKPPPSPDLPWGVPPRPLRVVCLDAGEWAGNVRDAAELVRGLDPDFVLAQRVAGEAVVPLAEALGMQRYFHPRSFVRLGPGAAPGCVILSKHPVFDAAPLRGEIDRERALGVRAASAVDGRRFAVASADAGPSLSGSGVPAATVAAALDAAQKKAGDPPLVAAFRLPPMRASTGELLKTARLEDVGVGARGPGTAGVAPLIAVAGPWSASPESATRPTEIAPGIVWVELGPAKPGP